MRIKWFSLSPSGYNINVVGEALLRNIYSEEVGQGFTASVITDAEIVAKFYNKIFESREILTPSGELVSNEQVYYDITRFTLRKSSPYLRVEKMPRRSSVFLLAFVRLLKFKFALVPIVFNIELILESLEKEFDKVEINKLRMSGVRIDDNVSSDINLSGLLSIDKSIKMFNVDFDLSIVKTSVSLFKCGKRHRIEIDRKGELVFVDGEDEAFIDFIDNILHDVMHAGV